MREIYPQLVSTTRALLPPKVYHKLKRYKDYLANVKYYGDGVYNIHSGELQPPSKPVKSQNKNAMV